MHLTPISNQKVTASMSKKIIKKYLAVNLSELNNATFYNTYTQVLQDFPARVVAMQNTISDFIGNILSITTIVTLIVAMSPMMIIVSGVSIAANLFITPILDKVIYESYLAKTKDNRIQGYIKRIFYIYEYIKELKLHSIGQLMLKKYDNSNTDLINLIKKYSKKNLFFVLLLALIDLLGFTGILIYLAYTGLKGVLSVGEVSSLYNATEELKSNILSVFSIVPRFLENSLYVENYRLFMSTSTSIENDGGAILSNEIRSIVFKDVTYSYTDDLKKTVLNNINLTIGDNQKIALVGHNGAGKSTFVNILTRLYDPLLGDVYINGENYRNLNFLKIKNKFLVIFQDAQIYAVTIAENILMRELRCIEDEKIVINALTKVGLYEKIQAQPKGINAILTKEFENDGVILSGGERQKLIVARVLASTAKVIVLDEVTSNMDAISEHIIFEQIIQFATDKIVVYISHKLSTAKIADKIYLLENGKIIEEGSHRDLISMGGKYKEMFLVQAEKYGND